MILFGPMFPIENLEICIVRHWDLVEEMDLKEYSQVLATTLAHKNSILFVKLKLVYRMKI